MTGFLNPGPRQEPRIPTEQIILIWGKSISCATHRNSVVRKWQLCNMTWTGPWQRKVYLCLSLVTGPWGFQQCASPYQFSHVLAGFPVPYLSSQRRSASKTAMVIHSKSMTWEQSQDPQGPTPPQDLAEVQVGDSQQLNNQEAFRKP